MFKLICCSMIMLLLIIEPQKLFAQEPGKTLALMQECETQLEYLKPVDKDRNNILKLICPNT